MQIVTLQYARTQGLARYFTGRPCSRGHVAERYTQGKTCVECKKARESGEGRPAQRAAVRRWCERNPGLSKRRWSEKHPDRRRASDTATYQRRKAAQMASAGSGITPEDIRRISSEQIGLCAYCCERRPLTLDHVHPLSLGGAHDVGNAVMACGPCNYSKQDRPLLYWLATR